MSNSKSNSSIILGGILGLAAGGFVGFLIRPSQFGYQLPFREIISGVFGGNDVSGLARISFNFILAGAILGVICGILAGYLIKRTAKPGESTTAKKLKPISIIFALFGLLLFAYFVWKAGAGEIASGIRRLGAGFLLVLAISSLRYVVRTLGWTLCFTGKDRLRFRDAFRAYVVGDAMGNLTPLGIVASEPTKAALVRDRVPLVTAISALAVQNLFYSLSVAFFILSGIIVLLLSFPLTPGLRLMTLISLGVVSVIIVIGFVIYHMRWKFLTAAFERLRRNRFGKKFLKEKQKASTSAVEETVYSFYARNKARCALILTLEACFHLAGVLEVYVTLLFISDVPPTFLAAYVLESVNRIINVVFKFVPLRAGVDEAGSSWVTKVLKFGVTAGTTLAIIRKARVICWTALGVAFLVRRGLSTQAVVEEAEEAVAEELGAPVPGMSEQG